MNKNYIDVTKEWLNNATPNSHEVEEQLFFEYMEEKYFVDGKNVILDYSKKEREVAEWLKKTFGGEIKMVPRVNFPDGIQTPDYIFRNEKWDLKVPFGNGKRLFEDLLKKKRKQAINFIIDISKLSQTNINIDYQIDKVYFSETTRWVNKIMIIKKEQIVKIYERKRD